MPTALSSMLWLVIHAVKRSRAIYKHKCNAATLALRDVHDLTSIAWILSHCTAGQDGSACHELFSAPLIEHEIS